MCWLWICWDLPWRICLSEYSQGKVRNRPNWKGVGVIMAFFNAFLMMGKSGGRGGRNNVQTAG